MEKNCGNCKYFTNASPKFCDHKNHKGDIVQEYTVCPEFETKELDIVKLKKALETLADNQEDTTIVDYSGNLYTDILYLIKIMEDEKWKEYHHGYEAGYHYGKQDALTADSSEDENILKEPVPAETTSKRCSCYKTKLKTYYVYDIFGHPVGKDRSVGYCSGTRECDECRCGGDESICDFYPEKRKTK